jgi:nitrogen fixation/metabolism regulation signal transduction histidine kinase
MGYFFKSLKNKINFSYFIIVAVCFVMVFAGYIQIQKINTLAGKIVPYSEQLNNLQNLAFSLEILENNIDKFDVTAYTEYFDTAKTELESSQKNVEKMIQQSDEASKNKLNTISNIIPQLRQNIDTLITLLENNRKDNTINSLTISIYNDLGTIRSIDRELIKSTNILIHTNISEQKIMIVFLTNIFLGLTIIVVITSILMSIFLSKSIIQPTLDLTQTVEEINRGNLDKMTNIKSDDEIGQLGKSFNVMTTNLKTYRTKIEQINASLEKTVKERTNELNNKMHELEKMNQLMIGRELTMIEMKNTINNLEEKLNNHT